MRDDAPRGSGSRARGGHPHAGDVRRAVVNERHRHRYEVNNHSSAGAEEAGLVVSDHQEGRLVEIIELPDHPWFVASQFHPEFKSRPTRPARRSSASSSAPRCRTRARRGVAAEQARVPA